MKSSGVHCVQRDPIIKTQKLNELKWLMASVDELMWLMPH